MLKKTIVSFLFLFLLTSTCYATKMFPVPESDVFNFGDNYLGYSDVNLGNGFVRAFFGWAGEGQPWFDVMLYNQTDDIGITGFSLSGLGTMSTAFIQAQDWQNNQTPSDWTGWTAVQESNNDILAYGVPVYSNDFYGNFGNNPSEVYDHLHFAFTLEPLFLSHLSLIEFGITGMNRTGEEFSSNGSFSYGAAPAPEPATILLLGSGLIGLVGFGRKKFKKS